MSHPRARIAQFQTAEALAREAEGYSFSTNRNLRQWLRSGKQLLIEAAICEDDGDFQTAYVYLYRYANMLVEKLPRHPEYDDPEYKQDLRRARRDLVDVMPKLERWKPKINEAYDRYVQLTEKREAERQRDGEETEDGRSRRNYLDDFQKLSMESRESSSPSPTYALDPNEHRQLALDFAKSELERRKLSRKARQNSERSLERSTSSQLSLPESDIDDCRIYHYSKPREDRDERTSVTTTYQYPSIPERRQKRVYQMSSHPLSYQGSDLPSPIRPAKESIYSHQTSNRPTVPAKYWLSTTDHRESPPISPSEFDGYGEDPQPPSRTRSVENPPTPSLPVKYTFKPTAFTESGAPLRSLFLPSDLRRTFLNVAHLNTARNLETCGILAGTQIAGALFINQLIIPDQTSTGDTCDTTEAGDAALFDHCDAARRLVCGWIHTHPSQSCFLSSRDLHTSAGYQVMLAEAIAIVCAPRHNPDWGIFRLTAPPGLDHVLDCRQTAVFHPHHEPNLYTDALRPGHVVEGPGLKFEVVDLRVKRNGA